MKKDVKFDAKSFLNLKTLSPLEENGIKGGLSAAHKIKLKQKSDQ